jgi:hypothetical protein
VARRVGALGLDLGWASPTGWALVCWELGGEDKLLGAGDIVPPKRSGKVTDETHISRAASLYLGLVKVIEGAEVVIDGCDSFAVCYEDVGWLLAAARKGVGKSKRKPVTVDSLMASVYPVAVMWLALSSIVDRVSIEAVRTRSARSQFGVAKLVQGCDDTVRQIAEMPEYGSIKKAAVGVAVAERTGWGIPASSHIADALLLALVGMDGRKMLDIPKP